MSGRVGHVELRIAIEKPGSMSVTTLELVRGESRLSHTRYRSHNGPVWRIRRSAGALRFP